MSGGLFGVAPGPGILVTIDGPNGSGKTSLAAAIVAELRAAGQHVHSTCQPSPTPIGEMIRNSEQAVRGKALACLVAGDRHQQAETEVVPQLLDGTIVVCDRYVESSLVLQRLDEVDVAYILAINEGIPKPGLRIRLTAAPEVLAARIEAREASPERRFESSSGTAREIRLYDEADALIEAHEGVPSTLYDTSSTRADELAAIATRLILGTRASSRT